MFMDEVVFAGLAIVSMCIIFFVGFYFAMKNRIKE